MYFLIVYMYCTHLYGVHLLSPWLYVRTLASFRHMPGLVIQHPSLGICDAYVPVKADDENSNVLGSYCALLLMCGQLLRCEFIINILGKCKSFKNKSR
jgi:hypothetical protein